MEICAVTRLSPSQLRPYNLPNQENRKTNWAVQRFQGAITTNHRHDPEHAQVHSKTTGPGRIMFVPKIGPQSIG